MLRSARDSTAARILLVLAIGALFLTVVLVAQASKGVVSWIGGSSSGSTAGLFNTPRAVAVNSTGAGGAAAGDIYVADSMNNRIQQFHADGIFVRAWGANAVAAGPDNGGSNEVQSLKIVGTRGTFTLTFEGQTTAPISFEASASKVEAELDALSTIGGVSGSVAVTGGPVDATGSSPYVVTFGGALGGTDVGQIAIDSGGLGVAIGTQLSCSTTASATTIKYQWLRNGTPIDGATASAYTTSASSTTTPATTTGDAGASIQCQVFAINTATNSGSTTQVSNPVTVVDPDPATPPPVAPATISLPELSGAPTLRKGHISGAVLICNPGVWTGASSFTYHWYKNGVAFATGQTYAVSEADIATPGAFQCAVTATNAGGSTTKVSQFRNTISASASPVALADASVTTSVASTTTPGVTAFEICQAGVDTCQKGFPGAFAGALSEPTGIAVDQEDGSVYVFDQGNRRVDKFSAEGVFLFAFGAGVESGSTNTLQTCTSVSGCLQGLNSAENGGFASTAAAPSLAVAPPGSPNAGDLFVADPGNRRIEEVGASGTTGPAAFLAKVGAAGAGNGQFGSNSPTKLAVDDAGRVYAIDTGNDRVQRFEPSLTFESVYGETQLSGSPAPTDIVIDPSAVSAGDASDDHVFVVKPCDSTLCPSGSYPPPFSTEELRVDELGTASDPALIDTHMVAAGITSVNGLALDTVSNRLYVSSTSSSTAGATAAHRVYVLDDVGLPTAQMQAPAANPLGSTSATLDAEINPNGPPDVSYRFEYSLNGINWTALSSFDTLLGSQLIDQSISQVLDPPLGLEPATLYHVRVVATRPFNQTVISPAVTFTTLAEKPVIEAVGSPLRTATTARLDSHVDPRNSATTYRFEYGDQGPCDSNPCVSEPTPEASAGAADDTIRLVSQQVTGLQPGTAYHYRLVATNTAGTSYGEDMTVTTRASDAPLTHGHFPGPTGSDRAWEQVSTPDTSGNPVTSGLAFSDDGDRAYYEILGGVNQSNTGSSFGDHPFAERTPQGWQSKNVYPAREELVGSGWTPVAGSEDLSNIVSLNTDSTGSGGGPHALFRMKPDAPAALVFNGAKFSLVSNDGTRVVAQLSGAPDPAYPETSGEILNFYDVSSGTPHLLGLLPGGGVPACGAGATAVGSFFTPSTEGASGAYWPLRAYRWLSPDGSLFFFPSQGNNCSGPSQLYVRDIEAGETTRISPPALSGPECSAALVKSTPGAVFFWTQSRLVSADTAASGGCDSNPGPSTVGGDIYRYDLTDHSIECVTCVVPGLDANVQAEPSGPLDSMVVAADGSRVYFTSSHRLLAGAAEEGIYRVDVADGDLAYVAPGSDGSVGEDPSIFTSNAANSDGSAIVFQSANTALDSLTGSDNGGTRQDYIYEDHDRSLSCASCPQDGSAPTAAVSENLTASIAQAPNITPLADNGDFAFSTPTPLVAADQNTAAPGQQPVAGTDVYEWRDGRQLLVTDGLTPTEGSGNFAPAVQGVDPSGRDIFFTQSAQYTPDALDAIQRLYDARIGGGIEFPAPPHPCPLEVCQGTAKGAPEEAEPGSAFFSGPGNVALVQPLGVKPKSNLLTRAQRLAKALRACGKDRAKRKRIACKRHARKRYGARAGNKTSVKANIRKTSGKGSK